MGKKRDETMAENRMRLLSAARRAFAAHGFSAASMDELTAEAGLTRGALYHNFGDKKGLFAAVVAEVDGEMAARAKKAGARGEDDWSALMLETDAYIEMALDPEVQRIVLLDGPAFLGDPSQWPSQNACLQETREKIASLVSARILKPVDVDAAARLLSGAALNAALWVAASDDPRAALPKATETFRLLAAGLLADRASD
ncbi:TetR/AcrR family transcriptional regulator [Rhizobium sp. SSA_523]|uniref:TetR/AcrR family transcriptional regulator n=1 Tax=Rhizobium sp. SSA_523 TaxID=2952477 RepID=UPI002090B18D|nr:TetR/AcrR family transcriptional regulator [Rhizobium sp. SSA_523]MCO5732723.1 TetR/AcrR family transcriptional regulator [Rhizobium sp. SSA_523]WKC23653.1 TetR/AcrR family transcriptional regulator [Rhizobium sp. SSA_523]